MMNFKVCFEVEGGGGRGKVREKETKRENPN
jgi:hypothetical protein